MRKRHSHRGIHAKDIHRIGHHKPTRYRYHGVVHHRGKLMRQRLGFYGGKRVVEVAYVPYRS